MYLLFMHMLCCVMGFVRAYKLQVYSYIPIENSNIFYSEVGLNMVRIMSILVLSTYWNTHFLYSIDSFFPIRVAYWNVLTIIGAAVWLTMATFLYVFVNTRKPLLFHLCYISINHCAMNVETKGKEFWLQRWKKPKRARAKGWTNVEWG